MIISLLGSQSTVNGINLGPLPGLFELVIEDPTFKTNIVATKATGALSCIRCTWLAFLLVSPMWHSRLHSGQQFDVDTAILKSLVGLKVDLAVSSDLDLDSYATSLSFTQRNVTTNVRQRSWLYWVLLLICFLLSIIHRQTQVHWIWSQSSPHQSYKNWSMEPRLASLKLTSRTAMLFPSLAFSWWFPPQQR